MQNSYRLVASDSVKALTRIDTKLFPEMIPYMKDSEHLFLVPRKDLDSTAAFLRTSGAKIAIGVSDEGLTQLPPLNLVANA
jgi:hypothetical protein